MKFVAIMQYLPTIIAIIRTVEDAIPGKGQGEAKLAAVREMLELADMGFQDALPTVDKLIGILVALFNKAGIFRKESV